MMKEIEKTELEEILRSYGIEGLVFDKFLQAEPDLALYFFHDNNGNCYCLFAADTLNGYDKIELPYDFEYSYLPYRGVRFRATNKLSYINNAPRRAKGYIDDDHLWTLASTGDICMLFACEDIKYN